MFPEDVILFHFQPWTPSAIQLVIHKALIRVVFICHAAILSYIEENVFMDRPPANLPRRDCSDRYEAHATELHTCLTEKVVYKIRDPPDGSLVL